MNCELQKRFQLAMELAAAPCANALHQHFATHPSHTRHCASIGAHVMDTAPCRHNVALQHLRCCPIKTVWPSGLRRWLQVPVRKGVGSNPTAVSLFNVKLQKLVHGSCGIFHCMQGGDVVWTEELHLEKGSLQHDACLVCAHPLPSGLQWLQAWTGSHCPPGQLAVLR